MGNIISYCTSKNGKQEGNAADTDILWDSYNIRAKRQLLEDAPECAPYYDAIVSIVNSPDEFQIPTAMTKLNDVLYLGSLEDAKDVTLLKEKDITHIINTVEDYTEEDDLRTRHLYGERFKYMGFQSDDSEYYPIMNHFGEVYEFIEDARKNGGKCLIHCIRGVNRSGVLATAYIMAKHNVGPITAAKSVHKERGMLLSNYSFISRLLIYAKENGYLKYDENYFIWESCSQPHLQDPSFNENILPNLQKNAPECIPYYNIIFDIVNDETKLKYPKSMTKLTDHLYLGNIDDAQDLNILKANGITHIIDTVKSIKIPKSPNKFQNGNSQNENPKILLGEQLEYLGFTSQDDRNYPIMDHFEDVFKFIENAKEKNGKCLIHCLEGINRSGVLATAYVMVKNKIGPIPAVKYVFERRGMILSNTSFIVKLLILAKEKKLLEVGSESSWPNLKML